jgi:hypothetical protein
MPHHVANTVIQFPVFGQVITLDDQGVYYAQNANGDIVGVFQLAYENDWYLFQLNYDSADDEASWSPLTGQADAVLNSMSTEQIRYFFSKPEYAEPRGAWQVIKNSKFGIGKFTPLLAGEPICYAMLVFVGDNMLKPIRIHKLADHDLSLTQVWLSQAQ